MVHRFLTYDVEEAYGRGFWGSGVIGGNKQGSDDIFLCYLWHL